MDVLARKRFSQITPIRRNGNFEETGMKAVKTMQLHSEKESVETIKRGFSNNRFFLRTQPIVPLNNTNNYNDFEVFLAVKNDSRHFDFTLEKVISILESNNETIIMDEFVIQETLIFLNKTDLGINGKPRFHINLSGKSLNNIDFMEKVLSLIKSGEIPPDRICFEVTETALIESFKPVANFIYVSQLYGCKFSLDDFGKGYSSFTYLMNLPFNSIKIDGCYIKEIQKNHTARSIIKSLAYLAKDLNLSTVAECIEDVHQYEIVKSLGIDYGQGRYFEAPSTLKFNNECRLATHTI